MNASSGLRLGRILGIEIDVDWSLLVVFLLVTFGLAAGLFPAWHPDWGTGLVWGTSILAAVAFFASVLAHELSHALVGRANGITVRRITLFMFGGLAHMENEPPSWRSELAMALVGPVTSLALGAGFTWLASVVGAPLAIDPERPRAALAALGPLPTLLLWLGPVNILLGAFNLVPGFPLDGGRVLRSLMWGVSGDLRKATLWASRAGQVFAWLLVGTGFAMALGLTVPVFGTGLVGGLWLVFIGWFLNNAAVMSYRQLVVRESLEDVPIERLMRTSLTRVTPDMALATLVDEHLMPSGQRTFPVEEGGRFVGLVSLRDLHGLGRHAWETASVRQVMTPVERLVTVSPRVPAIDALSLLNRRDVNQLPVVDGGHLVGFVRREDVLKWLALHGGGAGGFENPR
jgi:Zn-dependent protease/predicted transcriptional regulator